MSFVLLLLCVGENKHLSTGNASFSLDFIEQTQFLDGNRDGTQYGHRKEAVTQGLSCGLMEIASSISPDIHWTWYSLEFSNDFSSAKKEILDLPKEKPFHH